MSATDKLFDGIKDHLPYSQKEFLSLLTELAIATARVLDNKFGPLGKLGLDIAAANMMKFIESGLKIKYNGRARF